LSTAERAELSPKGNVPNLRFPEFKGEWKRYKLEDIAKRVMRKNKGNISKLPLTISAQYGLVDQITFFNKVVASSNMSNYYLLKQGEFAYNKSYSSDYPWGAIKRLEKYNEGALSSLYICFAPTELVDSDYLVHYFETTKWYQGISEIAVEGARNHGLLNVAISDYFGTCHFIPQNMAEQKKLARFLNLIDERIDTQNKIIEKLQSLIKGIIDALLNNPSWEKAYLSSFMQFYSTNSLSWDQLSYTEGEIRNLHYGLIHSFQTIEIDTAFLPKIQQSFIPKQYTLCHAGDVAFADASEDTNEIGKTIEFIAIDSGTVCGLHTIHGRDIKNKTLVGFKGYVLNSRYFHDQIRRLAQGTKVFSITANNLSSCFVYIPELTKQKNIVKLLNAYEELLSTNKILLKQYENQKGYLLQQMFI
jgi:type I restriction enzyme S subunit